MCKGIILNGESLYLLCGCYIIAVNLNELNLKGSATKLNDGGLIYNREALNIQ